MAASPPLLLAIDIGTTSAKGLLINTAGEVIASEQKFSDTVFPQPGFAEQNPQEILDGIVSILQKLSGHEPVAICFSAAMHSLMATDEKGKALTPLMLWSDTRSIAQAKRLHDEHRAQRLYEITGTPVHPMSPLCKLLWLKENDPDTFAHAHKFISIKEYVLFHLTGEFVVDYSIASATGMFDLGRRCWADESLSLVGISAQRLSNPANGPKSLFMKAEYAQMLNLVGIPLILGASDGCLAQLGSQAMGDGDMSITIGTSGAVRMATKQRKPDALGRVFNYILDDHHFICGGATNSGTALLQWYSTHIDSSSTTDLHEFAERVKDIPAGSEGLVMIPYLLGERAPLYQPEVKGAFLGITIQHTSRHFQRALLEGICFQLRWIAETVEEVCGPARSIYISGGFTRSAAWMQMLSDVLGKELILREENDASAIGAAQFGFRTLAIPHEFSVKTLRKFKPDSGLHSLYSASYLNYRRLNAAINQLP
ncbi:MAG: gluconokinase [Bacteroidetes bacterium]|nr:gluconokinase [Bacteroidota bacterium]